MLKQNLKLNFNSSGLPRREGKILQLISKSRQTDAFISRKSNSYRKKHWVILLNKQKRGKIRKFIENP